MSKISERTGNLYRKTAFNGGWNAGPGITYDRYDEESGYCGYDEKPVGRVRLPNDGIKPEELNGPVVVIKKGNKLK